MSLKKTVYEGGVRWKAWCDLSLRMYAQCLGAATSHVPGHKLRELGNDNVLRDQGSHTPHEYVAMGKE